MGDRVRVRREGKRLIIEQRRPSPFEIGCAWTAAALMAATMALVSSVLLDFSPFAWVILGPMSAFLLLFAAAFPYQAWRVESTSHLLILTRDGLFGGRRRSWPAEDLAAVWLEGCRSEDIDNWTCRVRFKDGTVHALLSGGESDMRRLCDALRNRPREKSRVIGTCRVCGTGMSRRLVSCARCRTPHHAECWTYVGMCSTYGCREIRGLS